MANNEAILLDVREQDEWNLGHLKAAVLAPLSVLEEGAGDEGFDALLGKLSKDKIIYCHCVSGGRVMPASKILNQQGYDVRPLKPGYDDLVEAGSRTLSSMNSIHCLGSGRRRRHRRQSVGGGAAAAIFLTLKNLDDQW